MDTAALKYIRTFECFGKSARFDLVQAYQDGEWTGLLDGAPASVQREGFADTTLRFAINLFGAPPLEGEEFAQFRAGLDCETIIGAGLIVALPTGEYFMLRAEQNWTELNRAKVDFFTNRRIALAGPYSLFLVGLTAGTDRALLESNPSSLDGAIGDQNGDRALGKGRLPRSHSLRFDKLRGLGQSPKFARWPWALVLPMPG
jgi:hypothetical protein